MSQFVDVRSLSNTGIGIHRAVPLTASASNTGGDFRVVKNAGVTAAAMLSASLFVAGFSNIGMGSGISSQGTTHNFFVISPETSRRQSARSTSSLLTEIKAILGFSVTQLSIALQVTRQIVYRWLDDRNFAVLQPKNRERLDFLHDLAQDWRLMSSQAIGPIAESMRVSGNQSLMDLLAMEATNRIEIRKAMFALASNLNEAATPSSQFNSNRASREALATYARTIGTSSRDEQ